MSSVFLLKELPGGFVVLFTVAAVEGGVVFDGALNGAAGHGVIGDGAGKDVTGGGVLHDAVPRGITAVDRRNDIGILKFGTGEADSGQAAIIGEDDAPVCVVPCIGFIGLPADVAASIITAR